jgi:uncharacterized protein (TIGR02996 family)
MHPKEHEWLAKVVASLLNDELKLVYADWLEELGDKRAKFLRNYVAALRSMQSSDFPRPRGLPEEWLELIGFRLTEQAAHAGFPELKEPMLRLARPALRMSKCQSTDKKIPVGASKIGGLPDLPRAFPWPKGDDCRAIYNSDTRGVDRLAGFLGQVNLSDIAHTQTARDLPKSGVLSFFCFQDIENDDPDVIRAKAVLFREVKNLSRKEPPMKLSEGNQVIPPSRLKLEETLDLPEQSFDGPWTDELKPHPDIDYSAVLDHFRSLNFENLLGYARSTTGGDPTPSKDWRHLILLENSVGCRLHIQVQERDLASLNFDAIKLAWVDFD